MVFSESIRSVTANVNNATTTTVGWVSDPDGRGTFSLVMSCLLTLGLCIWSAMHLNIPPRKEASLQTWIRSIAWGSTGIFAPELVLFAAWRQYNSAKELQKQINWHMAQSVKSGNTGGVLHPWTMIHSFYAGMGGFTMELNSSLEEPGTTFIPGYQYLTISARGIAFLARCGHLPTLAEEDIVDKSKADCLAKSLVCLQAAYMVIQVIGRLITRLPITLLEVNILGHILCAFFIYVLWWHKARLVNEPTIIRGDWIKPLCVYMFICSQISGSKRNPAGAFWQAWLKPEVDGLAFFTSRLQCSSSASTQAVELIRVENPTDFELYSSRNSLHIESNTIQLKSSTNVNGAQRYFAPLPPMKGPTESYYRSDSIEQALGSSGINLERWRLAAEAVRIYPPLQTRFGKKHETAFQEWFEITPEELLTTGATNWPAEDLLRGTEGLVMGMTLWCVSIACGAVHIAAWNDYFPIVLEKWLWRCSAIYIVFSGILWLLFNLAAHEWKALDMYRDQVLRHQVHWGSYIVLGSLCTVCGVACIFARLFLVVEAFLSIRQLPILAYATLDWTGFLPHMRRSKY